MDSNWSKFGLARYDADGRPNGWCRLATSEHDDIISATLKDGGRIAVTAVNHVDPPSKAEESKMYTDMSYDACRARYEEYRRGILESIRAGRVSASMSGIEYYHKPWDALSPDSPADVETLKVAMMWNGVRHIASDWRAVLSVKHPQWKVAP